MIRVFDFKCENGHHTEGFVSVLVPYIPCAVCGKEATRQLSAPRIALDPFSGDFPSASDRWVKVREERQKQEIKTDRTHIE
jgi:hypothetical protein